MYQRIGEPLKESGNKLGNNIYDLIEENVVSFSRVDSFRKNLNISDDDERRVLAAIIYVMDFLCFSNSNTYNSFSDISFELSKVLGFSLIDEALLQYFNILLSSKKVDYHSI